MSAEIAGFDQRDSSLAAEVVLTAAAIDVETGTSADRAFTNRGAQYTAQLLFTVFRKMGVITGDIDPDEFSRHLDEIEDQTLPTRRLTTLERND